ncbi:universal stress protein [Marinobacterium sp. D7]|uniref:universal stress protein n=1 Tax=Marinobacterium ramblicola TaxID=2849041 RepID=UPI001C2D957E|nr:universal stress protein [Marinobacterium ramblicola]MBV1789481.1 universal stress protein [Marinobacterium ramblicola]
MMNPKTLLMPLSSSGQVKERLQGALAIAQYFEAHLDVMHAQVSPRRFFPDDRISLAVPAELLQQLETLATKSTEHESVAMRSMFAELCQSASVELVSGGRVDGPSATWLDVTGLRSEMVAERGKVSDMLVIPQPRSGVPSSTFESALMRSGKPVMLMPREQTYFRAERVAIAWNGSTEVSRAVSAALPILKRAQEVHVLTERDARPFKPDVQDLLVYLERHDVDAVHKTFDSHHKSAGEAIVDTLHDEGYDLLVMGAYTHRRVHEQVFGGVTSYVVGHARIPALMMH